MIQKININQSARRFCSLRFTSVSLRVDFFKYKKAKMQRGVLVVNLININYTFLFVLFVNKYFLNTFLKKLKFFMRLMFCGFVYYFTKIKI